MQVTTEKSCKKAVGSSSNGFFYRFILLLSPDMWLQLFILLPNYLFLYISKLYVNA